MATPHVAGAVALCLGEGTTSGPCAGLTPAQIVQKMRSDAESHTAANPSFGFGGDSGHPNHYFGYLPWAGAAPPPPPPPPPPTTVTAFPGATGLLTGKYRSCSYPYLRSDDNVFCSVDSTTSGVRVSAWYGRFSGVPKSLQNLRVTYKGKNSRSCTQTLAIQRISDGAWVTLDTRGVGTTEALIADKAPPGSPAGYVDGSGYLRVRVRCATSSWSFTSSGDLMKISYQRP
jgi:hypothetical protein